MQAMYVIIMLYWGGSGTGQGFMSTAEFSSKATCEAAGAEADRKFNSWTGRAFYWVCSPK